MNTYSTAVMQKSIEVARPSQVECGKKSVPTSNLRPVDLIAKLAGSNLKNTIRVIIAFEVLRDYFGVESDELLRSIAKSLSAKKPDDDNVVACDAIYRSLLIGCTDPRLLRKVNAIGKFGNDRLMMNLRRTGVSNEN